MSVPLDRVEATLERQREEARAASGKGGSSGSYARTANVIAVCEGEGDYARVRAVLASLVLRHPGRALLVVTSEPDAATPSIAAREVTLVTDPRRKHEPVAELVVLDVKGAARAWVPTAVERLLPAGAPTHLWWVGDLPDHDTLFDRLAEPRDMVLFDSSLMDLRDLPALAQITERAHGHFSVGDLGWSWLRLWQELLARFFDDAAVLPELSRVREVRVCCAPHRLEPVAEPASAQGALYAGWLLTRLGADARAAKWQAPAGEERVLTAPAGGHSITVRFITEPREGVRAGSLLRASLHTPDGSFTVTREAEDPSIFGWTSQVDGAQGAPAVCRAHPPDETTLLDRALDAPAAGRALFVRSLRAAAALARAPR